MSKAWPFADPENVAVITLKRILSGNSSILYVAHDDEDGAWEFLDGDGFALQDAALVSLKHVTNLDPSIIELADLPYGWQAQRDTRQGSWTRTRISD